MNCPTGAALCLPHAVVRHASTLLLAWLLALLVSAGAVGILASCSGGGGGGGGGGNAAAAVSPSGAAYTQPDSVSIPPAQANGIDTSGVNEGWVCASATSSSRLKFQVVHDDATYNYDLPNAGTPTLFPINTGNGAYKFRIMQNTEGNSYVELQSTNADVSLSNEFAPFLIPSQFCNYTADSACVAKARELTANAENEAEAVAAICTFVADNVSYDEAKARELSTATGYIPDPDSTLATGKGICFDYASLSAAMLRSMGLPTKLITGYVGAEQLYHAWIMVYVDGSWQTAAFSVSPKTWSRCDVTFASTGATQYSGSGEDYTDRYTY